MSSRIVGARDASRALGARDASRALAPLFALVALAAGCGHEYAYRPAVGGAAAGQMAARYPVPPEAPRGEVYLSSFGLAQMEAGPGRTANMPQVRLGLINTSDAAWTVDGREQELLIPGQPPLHPTYINTDSGAAPAITIVAGQRAVMDVYYSVPPGLDRAENLPSFEVVWRVRAGARVMEQRTPFQRILADEADNAQYPVFLGMNLGWGVGWWYDPLYPYRYPPIVRGHYYPHGWNRPSAWRGSPPAGGGWRGSPPGGGGGGGWRGSPPGGGGGWRGSPRR